MIDEWQLQATKSKKMWFSIIFFKIQTFPTESFISQLPTNHSIGFIYTNKKELFKNSRKIEVWISNHCHLFLISMGSRYIQGKTNTKLGKIKTINVLILNLFCQWIKWTFKSWTKILTTHYLTMFFFKFWIHIHLWRKKNPKIKQQSLYDKVVVKIYHALF